MKKLLFVFVLLLSSCQPSPQSIQTSFAQTQAALPSSTPSPTNTVIPTDTPIPVPTNTPRPTTTNTPKLEPTITTTPQISKTVDSLITTIQNLLVNDTEVYTVNTIKPGKDSLEIELWTGYASKDGQPNISFGIIQLLAVFFNSTASEEKDISLLTTGNPPHFSVLLTTYSDYGEYKYSSLTNYETLVKVYNKQLTFDEWVKESGAGFVN